MHGGREGCQAGRGFASRTNFISRTRVPRPTRMTDVVFLSSVQGYQTSREKQIVDRLKAERTDLTIRLLSPDESKPLLAKSKLKFGPAVLINNRLEFIGVPRYRMLLERIEISKQRALTPPAPPTPAPAAAPAPRPAAPPTPPPAKPPVPPKPADSPG